MREHVWPEPAPERPQAVLAAVSLEPSAPDTAECEPVALAPAVPVPAGTDLAEAAPGAALLSPPVLMVDTVLSSEDRVQISISLPAELRLLARRISLSSQKGVTKRRAHRATTRATVRTESRWFRMLALFTQDGRPRRCLRRILRERMGGKDYLRKAFYFMEDPVSRRLAADWDEANHMLGSFSLVR